MTLSKAGIQVAKHWLDASATLGAKTMRVNTGGPRSGALMSAPSPGLLPPTRPEAVAGYVIMEQVEYPGMSGTNTIAVATVLIETGMVEATEPVTRQP